MNHGEALSALGRITVHDDAQALTEAAARFIAQRSERALQQRRCFNIALAGGNTPKHTYELLASPAWHDRIRWDAWRVYFGDERAVPPDDERSNYRMAQESLLSRVPIAEPNVHRMLGELDPSQAADAYHTLLEDTLPLDDDGVPQLDLVLLGLGENGHTASLFPDTPALEVVERWATHGRADYKPYDRITLTYSVLNAASDVAFLVEGAGKHQALHQTARGRTPAARVQPRSGPPHWLLDREAAMGDPAGA